MTLALQSDEPVREASNAEILACITRCSGDQNPHIRVAHEHCISPARPPVVTLTAAFAGWRPHPQRQAVLVCHCDSMATTAPTMVQALAQVCVKIEQSWQVKMDSLAGAGPHNPTPPAPASKQIDAAQDAASFTDRLAATADAAHEDDEQEAVLSRPDRFETV